MKTFTEFLSSRKSNNNLKNKVVIFGAGNLGTLAIKALRQKDIAVDYFSDIIVTEIINSNIFLLIISVTMMSLNGTQYTKE